MNDQILNGYLQDFREQHGFEKLTDSELFSYFVTYGVVSKQAGSGFTTLEDLDVDGGQDTGIDAIAIVINDNIVTDPEAVDHLRKFGRLEVDFIFIQSKSSAKFDAGDIGNFLFGVKNFFSTTPTVQPNESVAAFREIKDYIYQNSIHLKRRPVCRLFYASSGKWTNDEFLTGRISPEIQALKQTDLFDDVLFRALDAERLKSVYRELRHRVEKEVVFEKHTILPKIDRVDEAYLGTLPSTEFLKLITDEEGEIQKSLFYDNVRDFQGGNSVNSEISATLSSNVTSDSFVLLNNGVTIVAKSIGKVGTSFRLSDYQIVNGCQTSHVLHLNKTKLGEKILVPIKLIVTSDPELTNQIIKATNRQTEVKLEAFESLTAFHRTLEEFYESFGKDAKKRLYYERRSKQYANSPIKPTSIVSLAAQAKSFLGMFLNEPHSTHRYYGEILESNRDRLFLDTHSPFPYYSAGLALSRIEDFFRSRELPSGFRRFKHHILLLFRLAVAKSDYPPLKGNAAEEYARKLCNVLWDEQKALTYFNDCVELLKCRLQSFDGHKQQADRLRMFTLHLLPSQHQRPQGTVKAWFLEREFGFVKTDDGKDIFVHATAIREKIHKYLREGERVEFDVVKTDRGLQARDLRIIPKPSTEITPP